ncbi:MAG: histidine phosphatase family protein [Patescibacteria group bacterium]
MGKEMKDKKERIENGNLTITFLRHSSKGPDGNLSKEGIIKASELDIRINSNSNVEIYTSDIQRSVDTGTIIGKKLRILQPKISPILSEHPYTDEKIEELGLSGGKWLLVENANRLLAGKLAKFTLDQLTSKKSIHDSQIIAISHVPPIMAFLGHILVYSEKKNSIDEEIKTKLFESFDGFVKPLKGFDIHIMSSNPDEMQVVFPKNRISIPISLLRNLAK